MSNKTIYVSDLDGTLLGADSRISKKSSDIISDLSRRGALITVATARTPATVVPLLEGTYTTPPAVVMTGAAMWHRDERTYSDEVFIPENDVVKVLDVCRSVGVEPFVYTMDLNGILNVYHAANRLNDAEAEFSSERMSSALKIFHLATREPEMTRHRTILFFAMGSHSGIERAAEILYKEVSCNVSCYPDVFNPDVIFLEIFAPGVSKASAVERLKKKTGANRLVVFGDSMNDIPMMRIADHAVAVDNALPEVKAVAHEIIGAHTEDSVARYIQSQEM